MSSAPERPAALASLSAEGVLVALGLVEQGQVVKSAGIYVDQNGYSVAEHLIGVFDQLVWAGWVSVAAGDPIWDRRALNLTEAGWAW